MIDNEHIEQIWKNFIYTGKSEFEFTRLDNGESLPEICIGANSNLNRCLLLELPKEHNIDFQTTVKKNLTLSFFKDTGYIVLELTQNSFQDLFNDLVLSIYQRIYKISDVDEYSKIFIHMFYKWNEFFDDEKTEKLSGDIIKGIFGEMFVLKMLIKKASSSNMNDILASWKGPYDTGHDFILDNKNIEVKTKEFSKSSVHISSEFQLEAEDEKKLELFVLSVETNSIDGKSIENLLSDIKEIVIDKLGDYSIVLSALAQKNIFPKNIYQYDNYRFLAIEQTIYNCMDNEFPKLIKSNIPKAIGSVKYNLKLTYLENFILSSESFDD